MSYWGFYKPYVSVTKRRREAQEKIKKLLKKNIHLDPVIIEGNAISKTWWGKSWNKNLESYSDYSNRIGRGRSYVRNRAVLDLQIKPGIVTSLVHGSSHSPYKIEIKIKLLSRAQWKVIKLATAGALESVSELLSGRFPSTLSDVFTNQKNGLFPKPDEISFSCTCPDYALMCKHVAATLYGVGARLDHKPTLFFTLRNVDMNELTYKVIEDKKKTLLKKSAVKSKRVIADSDLSSLFGVDIDEKPTLTHLRVVRKRLPKKP